MLTRLASRSALRVLSNATQSFRSHGVSVNETISTDKRPAVTSLSEQEQFLREHTRRFAETEIKPKVREMDEKSSMDANIIKACFDQGLMGIETAPEQQGAGLSFMSSILVIEELARVDPAVSVMVDVQNTLINTTIRKWASKAQQEKWLPRLATDTLGSFCLSEWGSGSDAFSLKTKAEAKGDQFVINGSKAWITNANEAGLYIVMANVAPEQGYKGITAFLVERSNPGLVIGKKEDKLGIRASSTCEVILKDCVVGKDDILGQIGKGYKIAIESLNEGRIGIAAQQLGLAQGAFDYTIPYLMQRKQFDSPIAKFQAVQHQFARASCEIASARVLTYNAARLKEEGKSFVEEAAMAKLIASEVAEKVSSACINLLGGVGFTKDVPVEKFFRDCKVGQIYEGTSNIQLQTIAKAILRAYEN